MTVESGIALAFATLVFAVIPGPGVSALVAQSLVRGFRAGACYAAGLVGGDLTYLLVALFGMGWVASAVGPWFVVFKWAGAAYLVYLGVMAWMARSPGEAGVIESAPVAGSRSFLGGLCVSLGNPKVIAFYCGFLPGFVHMPELTAMDMVLVVSIILPCVFMVLVGYAWLASRGRNVVRSTRLWKIMNRAAGTVMIGAGAVVASK